MAAGKKIIATDMELPNDILRRVSKASRNRFDARKLDAIEPRLRKDVEAIVLLQSGLVNKKLFKDFPNVKLLQSMSAGVDFIDFNSVPRGVTVCSNVGAVP